MLNTNLSRLRLAGWLLAVLSCAAGVAIAWRLGAWAYRTIDTPTFREYRSLIVFGLALPTVLGAVIVFRVGAWTLRRRGIEIVAPAEEPAGSAPAEAQPPTPSVRDWVRPD